MDKCHRGLPITCCFTVQKCCFLSWNKIFPYKNQVDICKRWCRTACIVITIFQAFFRSKTHRRFQNSCKQRIVRMGEKWGEGEEHWAIRSLEWQYNTAKCSCLHFFRIYSPYLLTECIWRHNHSECFWM